MAIALVEGLTNQLGSGQLTITKTFGSSVPVGRLITVMVGWYDAGGATQEISSVAGGAGNTYVARTTGGTSSNTLRMATYEVINVLAAAHTVTVTMSASTANRLFLAIGHWSGHHATASFSSGVGLGVVASANTPGSITATEASGVSLTYCSTTADRTIALPSGYTALGATQARMRAAYMLIPSAAAYSPTWTWTGGDGGSRAMHQLYLADLGAVPTFGGGINPLRSRGLNHGLN